MDARYNHSKILENKNLILNGSLEQGLGGVKTAIRQVLGSKNQEKTSVFPGVHWSKNANKWIASMFINRVLFSRGGWETEKAAAEFLEQVKPHLYKFEEKCMGISDLKMKRYLFRQWLIDNFGIGPKKISQFDGVYWDNTHGKWGAAISILSEYYRIGCYDEELKASHDVEKVLPHANSLGKKLRDIEGRENRLRYFQEQVVKLLGYTLKEQSSKYQWVSWNKQRKKWEAFCHIGGHKYFIQLYDDEHKAGEHSRLLNERKKELEPKLESLTCRYEKKVCFQQFAICTIPDYNAPRLVRKRKQRTGAKPREPAIRTIRLTKKKSRSDQSPNN